MVRLYKGHQKLGEKLIRAGKIDEEQLNALLKRQQKSGDYLGRLLVECGYLCEEELDDFLPKEVARQRDLSLCERQALDPTEFYRLQTALKFMLFSDDPVKTLLVTSAVSGEGKTACASYYAHVLATAREGRFLLVDADLVNPEIHKRHDLPPHPGWTDYLVNGTQLEDCLEATDTDNLQVLPAGTLPPNPAALFASRKMKEFVNRLKEMFDLVIFDSAPLIPNSATAILAANLDAAILVIKAGGTKRKHVKKTVDLLSESNTKILGVVLNQVVDHDLPNYLSGYSGRKSRYRRA